MYLRATIEDTKLFHCELPIEGERELPLPRPRFRDRRNPCSLAGGVSDDLETPRMRANISLLIPRRHLLLGRPVINLQIRRVSRSRCPLRLSVSLAPTFLYPSSSLLRLILPVSPGGFGDIHLGAVAQEFQAHHAYSRHVLLIIVGTGGGRAQRFHRREKLAGMSRDSGSRKNRLVSRAREVDRVERYARFGETEASTRSLARFATCYAR